MTDVGYKLICEEHGPNDLVEYARLADQSAFDFALISDHYHPWLSSQGESPLVWNVLGGISQAVDDLPLGTATTCPIIRVHPAIVAQAAATAATMAPNGFSLGLGTGEKLNEHVTGQRWPEHEVRLEMLEEAVEIVRALWEGETTSYHGEYYTVENARLYTLPDETPPIPIAADGPKTARFAGEFGDGLIAVRPDEDLIEAFEAGGGEDKPRYGEVGVCYAEDEAEAIEQAYENWTIEGLPGDLMWELPTTAHFEQATEAVSEDDIADLLTCGSDPDEHIETIREYVDAGFDHVVVHQIGSNQAEFVEFYEDEVLPAIE
ncbi:TIGR03557 family F420-dependent LLM class oxidoreductase [Halopiger xanaduensis]|uniref:F420-dependent oxidoreductase, G6PDH family n=1 Tax=Halopiger xanaduensis (strain DSM 18323 / JCM 14033 / SH-6) TaxID=797210 RepID=F8DBT4_HALXS|nr:TIGR03557 family F420-dependent LLM class oxidoreductase [Halopiger xanaduensis]AEH38722.1 F420-dependent oxidoreductase, G6PDH family [Halopiger xanaduensis SH-6]